MTKTELKEAARVLKSGGSKKRERRVAASTMSEAGSSKGGQARARNLTPDQLTEIARLGGLARQALARERKAAGIKPKARKTAGRALNTTQRPAAR